MWNRILRLVTPALLLAIAACAQTSQPHPAKPQFFAGTVTELNADHVTVSRTVLGRAPERRTFLITPRTKLGKNLRDRVRVTVRYINEPDGDVAIEILVRSNSRLRSS